jgi:lipoic acid synthetase
MGAAHISECIRMLKKRLPDLIVEALVPDFRADAPAIKKVVEAGPDVVSHNIETVERLTPLIRDRRAGYRQSIEALKMYKELSCGKIITKSGIMAGLGETEDEVIQAMADLRSAGVEIMTIGQYLRPSATPRHAPVMEFVSPERFAGYEEAGYGLGFRHMACGPFVRSSYKAGELFIKKIIETRSH